MRKLTILLALLLLCLQANAEVSVTEALLQNKINSSYTIKLDDIISGWVSEFGNRLQATKLTIKGSNNYIKADGSLNGIVINMPDDSGISPLKPQNFITSNLKFTNFINALSNYGGVLKLTKTDFINNTSSNNGGAIFNSSGTLTVTGAKTDYSEFYRNNAINGGAIYNNGKLSMKYALVGGVYTEPKHHLMSENLTIYDIITDLAMSSPIYESEYVRVFSLGNSAKYGGGIYNENIANISNTTFAYNNATISGGGIFNEGVLTLSSSILKSNTAVNGGAIFTMDTNPELSKKTVIQKSKFEGNEADNGGAIYVASGNVSIKNNDFNTYNGTANKAENGGAIFNNGTNTTISSSRFSNNEAQKGGDVYNTGTITISKSTFGYVPKTGKFYSYLKPIVVEPNYTIHQVGSNQVVDWYKPILPLEPINPNELLIGSYAKQGGSVYNTGIMRVLSSKFNENRALEGGAIYNDINGSLTIEKSTFKFNRVTDEIYNVFGGAIYNKGVLLDVKKSTFDGNYAEDGYGGAIYSAAENVITGSTFKNNYAKHGGAIYNNGISQISSTTFILNSADIGGAIYNAENGKLTLSKVTFGDKKKKQKYTNFAKFGSAIYNKGVADVVSSTIFYQNGIRGAIYNTNNLTIEESTVSYNTCDYGGGLYTESGVTDVISSSFTKNSAISGGAIYNNAELKISSSTIKSNIANGKNEENNKENATGGAIYNKGALTSEKTSFSSNKGYLGGAIFNEGETTLNRTTFTSNTALGKDLFATEDENFGLDTSKGGAIYSSKGNVVSNGSTYSKNSAIFGGAIYNAENSTLILDALKYTEKVKKKDVEKIAYTTFSKNKALHGGAIYNVGTINPNDTSELVNVSGKYTSNTATLGAKTYTITKDDIGDSSKYAEAKGGAIFNYGTLLEDKQIERDNKVWGLADSVAVTELDSNQVVYKQITENDEVYNYVHDYSSASNSNYSVGTKMDDKIVYNGYVYNLKDENVTVTDYEKSMILTDGQILLNGKVYDLTKVENPTEFVETTSFSTSYSETSIVWDNKVYRLTSSIRGRYYGSSSGELGEKEIVYNNYVYDLSKIKEEDITNFVRNSDILADDEIVVNGKIYKLKDGKEYTKTTSIARDEVLFNGYVYKISSSDVVYTAPTKIENGQIIVSNKVYTLSDETILKDNENSLVYLDKDSVDKENQIIYKGKVYNISEFKDLGAFVTGMLNIDKAEFTSNSAKNKVVLNVEQYEDEKTKDKISQKITMYAGKGGAIYNSSRADLNVSNSTFTKNSASQYGGAIANDNVDNKMYIKNSTFTSNSSKSTTTTVTTTINSKTGKKSSQTVKTTVGDGGAIYTNGSLYINTKDDDALSTLFKSNSAVNGGAIYIDGISEIYNTTFISNSATNGGAMYIAKRDDKYDETEKISIIEKSRFEKNKATTGGAIYNGDKLNFSKNEFVNNSSSDGAGAVYNTGTINQKATNYTGNKSIVGGAIVNTGTFTDEVLVETIDGEDVKTNSRFENNSAKDGQGGAIYNAGTLTLTGTYFNNNEASVGGHIYNSGTATIKDAIFDNTDKLVSVAGGVFYNQNELNISNNKFNNNLASYYGGVIYCVNGTYMGMMITSYGNINSESNTYLENQSYYGGAVFHNGGKFNSKNDTFTKNIANLGGAIYNNATTNLENSTFEKNESFYGGAIYSAKELSVKGGNFTDNDGYWSGAIYAAAQTSKDKEDKIVLNGKLTIDGTTFKGNYGRINAGALYIAGHDSVISNVTFDGNYAEIYGGAILIGTADDKAKLNSTTFTGNYVNANGGAIYNAGDLKINYIEPKEEEKTEDDTTTEEKGSSETPSVEDDETTEGDSPTTDGEGSGDENSNGDENVEGDSADGSEETEKEESIKYTTVIFEKNKADNGGAIYNVGKIDADNLKFVENTVTCHGGAIHNANYMKLSNAIFESNKADSKDIENKGGAIYNNLPTEQKEGEIYGIDLSKSVFGDNEADLGGAIYNVSNLNISESVFGGTSVETLMEEVETGEVDENGEPIKELQEVQKEVEYKGNKANVSGGAIYNKGNAVILTTQFANNTATENGGAIYNEWALQIGTQKTYVDEEDGETKLELEIYNEDTLTNIFDKNEAKNGGAICNLNYAYVNGAKFENNTASALGGAIYNGMTLIVNNTKFESNKAQNGGAIFSSSKINSGVYNSKFLKNTAENGGAIYIQTQKIDKYKYSNFTINQVYFGQYDADTSTVVEGSGNIATGNGGAIYIASGSQGIGIYNSKFSGNSAQNGNGGAIYVGTNAVVDLVDTSFYGNTASGLGGAIYADKNSKVYIYAKNSDIVFEGNKDKNGSNSIYLNKADLFLSTSEKFNIYIKDNISGENGKINKSGNVVICNESEISNMIISSKSGNTTVQNEEALVNCSLEMEGDSSLDIANNNVRTLSLNSLNLSSDNSNIVIDMDLKGRKADKVTAETVTGEGILNVSKINLVSNSKTPVEVNLSEGSEISSITATTAESAEATYKIKQYVDENGMLRAIAYGQKAKPCTLASPIAAQLGGYLTQINSYDQAFMNMDMNMLKTQEERNANRSACCGTSLAYAPEYNNGINQNGKGLWTRPYATFERVNLNNGPKVSNIGYGNFFGGDADMKYMNNGWSRQFSAYVGYNGSVQDYSSQSIDQNGGTLGVTEVWYKNNFFTGLTMNVGANVAQAHTDLGRENIPMMMAGIASKTGYNFEFKNGKFILQPSLLVSYSFVHSFAHDNGLGNRVSSSPLHAIQVAPGVKFIFNLPKNWQPYLAMNMRWNIIDKTHFSVQDVTIPDMSIDPYVEYGLGLQRKWGERFTGYGQAMVRNGGRNGVMLSFGFKWAIGK